MRSNIFLLVLLLSWLQYSLWLGKNGICDIMCIISDITVQQNNNNKLKMRNNNILAEINDLNSGQEAIEERSRNELGMIKINETFYLLIPEDA